MARLLLLADTHLGFDLPARPRVDRCRRGEDFFANTERALERALSGGVDLVVHGGDLFYRSRIPNGLAARVYGLLRRVADAGVPICVVPGNHERSRLPYPLLAKHPRIFIFDVPRWFAFSIRGERVVLGGFPFVRGGVRAALPNLIAETGLLSEAADVRLLCMHEAVEGAQVGANDFTFRTGDDVARGCDLPRGVAAVLSGHIHRPQVLWRDLAGRPLPAPVFYPGSIERTSIAERFEPKGYVLLNLEGDRHGGRVTRRRFVQLPTRPMAFAVIRASGLSEAALQARIESVIAAAPPRALIRLRVEGVDPECLPSVLRAEALRALTPPSMTCSIRTVC